MGNRMQKVAVTEEREMVVGFSCDKCGADIEGCMEPTNGRGASNPERALPVYLSGHYGGYFDCAGRGPSWLLCGVCADELFAAFPFFATALRTFLNREFGIPDSPSAQSGEPAESGEPK